jgi:putative Mn2+ efflux pump MntP
LEESILELNAVFFVNSLLLGVGLAMDAFSVSLANGLNEPCMKAGKMALIAAVFGVFQGMMPLLGWICIHTVLQYFTFFQDLIPWIALALLSYIGGKMLLEGIQNKDAETHCVALTVSGLLVQGVATSIDALSVGFTIAEYDLRAAAIAACMIAAVTFVICVGGLLIGRKAGTRLSWKAAVLGGCILIAIGIEIFLKGVFGA